MGRQTSIFRIMTKFWKARKLILEIKIYLYISDKMNSTSAFWQEPLFIGLVASFGFCLVVWCCACRSI